MANSHELQKAQYAYNAAVRDRVPLYDYKGIELEYSGAYNDYIGDPPPEGISTLANAINIAREKLTESYSFYELANSSYDNAVIIFEETRILVE